MGIIDTGKHLPKPTIADSIEFWSKRKTLVQKPIYRQSRRQGTILYGRHALNTIMGRGFQRQTYDYDVYSHKPLHHAVEIEQSIDRGTNSNLAYVEPLEYEQKGIKHRVWRVKTRPHSTTEADFNKKPTNLRYVKKHGVRFETLSRAGRKYKKIIRQGEIHRIPKALWDESDIRTYNMIKKPRRRIKI